MNDNDKSAERAVCARLGTDTLPRGVVLNVNPLRNAAGDFEVPASVDTLPDDTRLVVVTGSAADGWDVAGWMTVGEVRRHPSVTGMPDHIRVARSGAEAGWCRLCRRQIAVRSGRALWYRVGVRTEVEFPVCARCSTDPGLLTELNARNEFWDSEEGARAEGAGFRAAGWTPEQGWPGGPNGGAYPRG
nr:hypothetical protein OH837_12730 [Streptomyces canus]